MTRALSKQHVARPRPLLLALILRSLRKSSNKNKNTNNNNNQQQQTKTSSFVAFLMHLRLRRALMNDEWVVRSFCWVWRRFSFSSAYCVCAAASGAAPGATRTERIACCGPAFVLCSATAYLCVVDWDDDDEEEKKKTCQPWTPRSQITRQPSTNSTTILLRPRFLLRMKINNSNNNNGDDAISNSNMKRWPALTHLSQAIHQHTVNSSATLLNKEGWWWSIKAVRRTWSR